MSNTIKVLIADDHGIIREALKAYLEQQQEFRVTGEACTGLEVLEITSKSQPDVIIMDLGMPGMDGIECAIHIRNKFPNIKILALTSHDDEEHLKKCLLAGVNGYVLKSSFGEDLKLALMTVLRGGTYLEAGIAHKLKSLIKDNTERTQTKLSTREIQVISSIAKGLSLKDVAQKLQLSVKTVETYKSRSFEKLNISSRSELIRYALEQGWLKESN